MVRLYSTSSNVQEFFIVLPCVSSVCGQSKADIVFLVDESSSIGPNNFIKIKDFMFRVATYFPVIDPQTTQVREPVIIFMILNRHKGHL